MAATTRLYTISYGATTVSGTVGGARADLHGLHELSVGYDAFSCRFSVVIHHQTEATFRAGCQAFETAMSTSRQALSVILNGTEIFGASHAGNTGLNIVAAFDKPGSPVDTARSRLYVVTITGGLAPVGLAGRRLFAWRLDDSPAQETLTVEGEYTAVGGTLSRAQYLASIDARVSTITTALGGSWQLQADTHTPGDTDQETRFTRVYKRQTFPTEVGVLVSTQLFGQALTITRERSSASALDGRPPIVLTCSYRADVDWDTVDTGGEVNPATMLALWEDTVRPHLVDVMERTEGRSVAFVRETPGISMDPPGFNATLIGITTDGGSTLLRRAVVTADTVDAGAVLTYVWPTEDVERKDQSPTKAAVNQGPKRVLRQVEETQSSVGGPQNAALGSMALGLDDPTAQGGRAVLRTWSVRFVDRVEEIQGVGAPLRITDKITTALYELVADLEA